MKRDRKTPGIYLTELTAFPPSGVHLETAVPAFVGYTERADIRARSATMTPVRIGSLAEFHDIFGGAPKTSLAFADATPADIATGDYDLEYEAFPWAGGAPKGPPPIRKKLVPSGQLGLLYRSLSLFYANGGAVCYVVSVGPYQQSISSVALKDGVVVLEDQVGPTMIVVPDMSLLPSCLRRQRLPWQPAAKRHAVARMGLARRAQAQGGVDVDTSSTTSNEEVARGTRDATK